MHKSIYVLLLCVGLFLLVASAKRPRNKNRDAEEKTDDITGEMITGQGNPQEKVSSEAIREKDGQRVRKETVDPTSGMLSIEEL